MGDDGPGTPGLLRGLCSAVTHTLPATWAGISLVEEGQVGGTVTGSDGQARRLEGLQFELGEGPCVDAIHARRPVLEEDLGGAGFGRWPGYAPAAYQAGARGVFAFPLQVGAVAWGSWTSTRTVPDRCRPPPSGPRWVSPPSPWTCSWMARRRLRPGRLNPTQRGAGPAAGGVPGAGHGDGRPGGEPGRGDGAAARARLHGRSPARGSGPRRGRRPAAARAVAVA